MSNDLISRTAVIELAMQYCPDDDGTCSKADEDIRNLLDELEDLPSAQQWVPASERLPENDDWVIVTILDESGDTPWRYSDFGWYLKEANCWIVDAQQRKDVVAWMPLPEPYEEEEK